MKTHPLAGLRRPRILVATARIAGSNYSRKNGLRGLIKPDGKCSRIKLVETLRAQESEIEDLRLLNNGMYRAQRHVQILAALMVESKAL